MTNSEEGPRSFGDEHAPHSTTQSPRTSTENWVRRYLCNLGLEPTQGAELFRKVRQAGQLFDAIMAAKMRQGELSPPRLRLLLCLFANEAQGRSALNPTQLSEELALSKNTISAHLRGLEQAGLVAREVDPDDLRRFRIRLADAGRTWIRDSAPDHMRYLDGLIAPLAPQEVEQLQTLLRRLIDVLDRHVQEAGSTVDAADATAQRLPEQGAKS